MIWIALTFCVIVTGLEAKMYGERLAELQSQGAKLTWKPKHNKIFSNRDESEIKRFLGIQPEKLHATIQSGGKPKSSVHTPSKAEHGRKPFGGNKDRCKDATRYQSNYWEMGSNRRGFGGWGNNGNWNWGHTHNNNGQHHNNGNGNGNGNHHGNGRGWSRGSRQTHEGNRTLRYKRDVLPTNFDWRDHSQCESLTDIRYQQCGDCWAVSSASVMSDRYCLYTGRNRIFSAGQLTTCTYPETGGCDGGFPKDAMEFYMSRGVATGGDPTVTDERAGCLPYPNELSDDTECPTACDSGARLDSTKAGDYYEITSRNVQEIMQEIHTYGPVVAVFQVYDDFGYMGTGVYQHFSGILQAYHAVRLIGWGVENNVPYWLAANSWGNEWGDNGYFKILRGKNHCGIEDVITCVFPIEAWN